MPWIPCPCFNIGWSVASVQQRNNWNVNASLQGICRRLVNGGAIKGKSANRGLALNTEFFKKWAMGLLLLGEFGARVLFWIVCLGFFWLRFESFCGIFPNCYVPLTWRIKEKLVVLKLMIFCGNAIYNIN